MGKIYKGLTNLEIIGIAIRSEMEAASFYRDFADRVDNPLVKAKFKTLAAEEGKHAKMLRELYEQLSGGDKPRPPKGWKASLPPEFGPEAPMEDLLREAIAMEKRAQVAYRTAAGRSSDTKARMMLEYLVEFERGHQRLLEGELKFLERNPEWFEEPWHDVHVGP